MADPPISQLLRYSSDGIPDEDFSDPIPGATAQTASLDPDGRILIAGTIDGDYWLTRLIPTGDVDTTFAEAGTATFDFEGGTDTAHAIIIAPSGNLALIGVTDQAGDRRLSMARLTPDRRPRPRLRHQRHPPHQHPLRHPRPIRSPPRPIQQPPHRRPHPQPPDAPPSDLPPQPQPHPRRHLRHQRPHHHRLRHRPRPHRHLLRPHHRPRPSPPGIRRDRRG